LDRTLLVAPPDPAAREAILHHQLRNRRLGAGVSLRELAARTDEYSVTDLAQLCDNAAERAAGDPVRGGRLIGVRDFDAALAELRSSTGGWRSVARNATKFATLDGSYDDLHRYLKSRRMAP
jgi:SpoVK/Ycf46/Vps4 family AAA+-type ATPase